MEGVAIQTQKLKKYRRIKLAQRKMQRRKETARLEGTLINGIIVPILTFDTSVSRIRTLIVDSSWLGKERTGGHQTNRRSEISTCSVTIRGRTQINW